MLMRLDVWRIGFITQRSSTHDFGMPKTMLLFMYPILTPFRASPTWFRKNGFETGAIM